VAGGDGDQRGADIFPAFCLPGDGVRLADGGVWANNPAMVGVAEAVSMFGQPLDSVRLLSIGTASDTRTRKRALDGGGLLQWGRSPPSSTCCSGDRASGRSPRYSTCSALAAPTVSTPGAGWGYPPRPG